MKIAMIPVRQGSERLKYKNYLPLINGQLMVELIRDKCLEIECFDKIIISSDDEYFSQFCDGLNISFDHRPEEYASNIASTDMVMDYMFEQYECEWMMWVNAVSPLQTKNDIICCVDALNQESVDCIASVNINYNHCIYQNKPLNFQMNEPFSKTQDLEPIKQLVYSCMGWKRNNYIEARKNNYSGLFFSNTGYPIVSKMASLFVKTQEDFDLCQKISISSSRD